MRDLSAFIAHVPKTVPENLEWRAEMRRMAMYDREMQACLKQACFDDLLFFINAMCWLYEPRATQKIIPFTSWPHQDPAFLLADKAITDSEGAEEPIDVTWDKTRAQGATWMYLMIFLRRWLRDEMFSAGLVTRNMDLGDSLTDPDTLMWKLVWQLQRLPFWLQPKKWTRTLSDHALSNHDMSSTIVAYAATGDVASGGRKTVFGFDEVAKFNVNDAIDAMNSTQHVTNCRFLVSTHKGDSGVYYDAITGENNAVRIVLDWMDNPTQNKYLYRFVDGKVMPERDEDAKYLHKYAKDNWANLQKLKRRGFVKEGRPRSPWYDRQCLRPGATPRGIAQELDRNPRGTVGKLIDTEILDKMKRDHVRTPLWEGKLVFDQDTLEVTGLLQQDGGPLKLWFKPGIDHSPPFGRFTIGGDIAMGTGGTTSSNSSLIGIDETNGQQILEYASSSIAVVRFARLSVALCRWLFKAFLIWEATGPGGRLFSQEVIDAIGYGNIFYRDSEDLKSGRKTNKAGWWNGTKEAKADMFEVLACAMDDGKFIPRSEDLVRECGQYEWEGDRVVYKGGATTDDAGGAHGDRAIAAGVAWMGVKDRAIVGVDKPEEPPHDARYGTLAWRMEKDRAARRRLEEAGESRDYTIQDLLSVRND